MTRDDRHSDLDPQDRAAIRAAMLSLRQPAERVTEPRRFANLESWVAGFFLQTFRRPSARWCRQWWDHPEVVLRLTVLWTTWEQAAGDAAALAGWLRDFLDPALSVIFAGDGPFSACTNDRHQPEPVLRSDDVPAHWWPEGWWDVLAGDDD